MDTPNFPAMYMQTLLYQATKLKSKHSTAVGLFSIRKDRNDSYVEQDVKNGIVLTNFEKIQAMNEVAT